MYIDSQNIDTYVVEEGGHRLLKYDASKQNRLVIGKAGIDISSDYQFGNMRDVSLNSQKHIWVTDYSRIVE